MSIGSITVNLLAKTGSFETDMGRASKNAAKRAKEIDQAFADAGKKVAAGLAVIGAAAVAGFGLYIRNTMEAEKVQAQLTARIKDTGSAAGRTLAQLNEQAEKLQGVTVFDDEAIGGVQAMLLTFKQIQGANFDEATAAVLDLATAMGTDANAAALQLGKALNDPIKGVGALGKAGVQFSVDQKAMIKALVESGDTAGAQQIILKELEGQMGSAAEAARDTLGGALQALRNSFDNLFEGDTATPGVKDFRDAVESLTATLNDPATKAGFDAIVGGIVSTTNALLQGIGWWAKWGEARKIAMSGGEIAGQSDVGSQKRLDEISNQLARLYGRKDQALLNKDFFDPQIKKLTAEQDKIIKQLATRNREATVGKMVGDAFAVSNATGRGSGSAAPSVLPPTVKAPKAGGGTPKRDTSAADALRAQQEAQRELERLIETTQRAQEEFDSMAAQLAGPLAEAAYRFSVEQQKLNDLAKTGEIDTGRLTEAQANLRKEYDEDVAAINARLTPMQEVNAAIQEEIMLLGMSAQQQEVYNNLKAAGVQANSAFGQSIIAGTQEIQAMREQAAFMDDIKASLADTFVDFVSGAKSAKDAFGDFADYLFQRALQMLADKAIQAMFDAFSGEGAQGGSGSSGGGQGGGGWGAVLSSVMSAYFGGGKAVGGPVDPSKGYIVGEKGPEWFQPNTAGRISTASVTAQMGRSGSGVMQSVNFMLAAPTDPRTQNQIAARMAYETQRAASRNR